VVSQCRGVERAILDHGSSEEMKSLIKGHIAFVLEAGCVVLHVNCCFTSPRSYRPRVHLLSFRVSKNADE